MGKLKLAICGIILSASTMCEDFKATPAAGTRRMAEARLASCIKSTRCGQTKICYPPVQAFCLDAGIEKTCGEGFIGPVPCVP